MKIAIKNLGAIKQAWNQAYRILARMKKAGQIKQIGKHKGAVYERI